MGKSFGSLINTIKELFYTNKIDLAIGYKKGSINFSRSPFFMENANDADNLVFDQFCTPNLAVYLPKIFQKRNIKDQTMPKVGIVAKGCDARSIMGLIIENQVPRENVIIIGMPCMGMIDNKKLLNIVNDKIESYEIEKDSINVKLKNGLIKKIKLIDVMEQACEECQNPMLDSADIKITGKSKEVSASKYKRIKEFEAMPIQKRVEYFKKELSKCIRCNACRQACPNCYCKVCFVDQTKPQWIGLSDNLSDIMVYHLGRIFHQAGRCVGCDACVRACPQGVDLRLFTQKLVKDVEELFGYIPGISENAVLPLCEFKEGDPQDFITVP